MSEILYGTLKVTETNRSSGMNDGANKMEIEFIYHTPEGDKKYLQYSGVAVDDEEINKILARLGSVGWQFVYKQDHKTLFMKIIE